MLDHACFPHIVEDALRRTDHATLLSLRLVSKRAKALADAELFAHVLVSRSPDGKGYVLRSPDGGLPVKAGLDAPALLSHTRVLDVHAALAPSPLLSALAAIPTRRVAHHRLLAPPPTTYVQEYAAYMGSHWRDRTFCFEPPRGVRRYVVHLRYHVDRRLCELFGPAPSSERIAKGAQPEYILVFSGSPEPSAPSVPTHGLAASQRRTVHTLLYELAAAFEAVRRQGARLTVVGAEEFVGCLCGATTTAEAGRLFESKLALARREMGRDAGEGDAAPPVAYLSHGEYEAAIGGRAYEAETRPMQLY